MRVIIQEYEREAVGGSALATTTIRVPDNCIEIHWLAHHKNAVPKWHMLFQRNISNRPGSAQAFTEIYRPLYDLSGRPVGASDWHTYNGKISDVSANALFWDVQAHATTDTRFYLRLKFVVTD